MSELRRRVERLEGDSREPALSDRNQPPFDRAYRSLFEQTQDGAFIIDRSGVIVETNPAFAAMFGFGTEPIVGANIDEIFPETSRRRAFRSKLESEGAVEDFELKIAVDGGAERTYSISASAATDRDGKHVGFCGIVRDMTEQLRTRELLIQSERIRAFGEMAGAAAHNFNNLLQIVVTGTRLALANLDSGDLDEVKSHLEEVMGRFRSAAEMVKQLQSFSRIGKRKMIAGRVFDLTHTVERAIEASITWWSSDRERSAASISMVRRLKTECHVRGVESELFGVVVNLIWNAAEALPDGGEIVVSTSREDGSVVLTVEDNGVGIQKEHLQKVFQPFWTTKVIEGVGMGLPSSLGIVEAHGGAISVESERGAGTVVSVKLPSAEQPVARDETPEPSEDATKISILIVDDMKAVVRLVGDGLKRNGQTVHTALSGEEALAIFRSRPVDAVICDLAMPEMDGWEVSRRVTALCEEQGIPKIPFVLLTGWGGQVDSEKMAETGVDTVVEKPVDIPRLLHVVRDLVRRRRNASKR